MPPLSGDQQYHQQQGCGEELGTEITKARHNDHELIDHRAAVFPDQRHDAVIKLRQMRPTEEYGGE